MQKYKAGDKVVVRKDMGYSDTLRRGLEELNYILTILCKDDYYYTMTEVKYGWTDEYIIKLYEEPIAGEPINSRFEILDIRKEDHVPTT